MMSTSADRHTQRRLVACSGTPEVEQLIWPIAKVSKALGIGRETVELLMKTGELKIVRTPFREQVCIASVYAFVERGGVKWEA